MPCREGAGWGRSRSMDEPGGNRNDADSKREPASEDDSDPDHGDERSGVRGVTKHPVRSPADDLVRQIVKIVFPAQVPH